MSDDLKARLRDPEMESHESQSYVVWTLVDDCLLDEAADRIEQLERDLAEARKEAEKLKDALRPFAIYAEARSKQPLRGLGDEVHVIHCGTEFEASITVSHCNSAAAEIGKSLTVQQEGK